MTKAPKQVKYLTIIVILYMLAALSWWSILLLRMNSELQNNKLTVAESAEKLDISNHFERQEMMIYGEGIVFGLALIIGIYLLYRNYNKEVQLSRQQNNFLLSITHEFKSPLSVIKLILQTLGNSKLPEHKKSDLLSHGDEEVNRLESMVNNLLVATRMDHNYKANFEDVDLAEFLKEDFRLALNKRYEDRIRLDLSATGKVKIDKELFRIVIQNLLSNAVKYSGEADKIIVTSQLLGSNIIVSVADTGPGIPEQERNRIFDKFYRSENEDIRKTKGTGLGLYLVREILNAHNATITIEDNLPSGSLFKIKLPLA